MLLADKSALEWLPVSEAVIDRALEVQGLLSARRGNGRRRPVTDLMIAATAELHGAAVLHVDSDYDMIADDPAPSRTRLQREVSVHFRSTPPQPRLAGARLHRGTRRAAPVGPARG